MAIAPDMPDHLANTIRLNSVILLIAVCAGCVQTPTGENKKAPPKTFSGLMSSATPDAWREPGLWDFQVRDDDDALLGNVVLYLTGDRIEDASCADKYWQKAVVVYDDLDLEISLQKEVAYNISGPWLTVNLTSADCNIGHNFVGQVDHGGASGFFNLTHTFGGQNLGTFSAVPATEGEAVLK